MGQILILLVEILLLTRGTFCLEGFQKALDPRRLTFKVSQVRNVGYVGWPLALFAPGAVGIWLTCVAIPSVCLALLYHLHCFFHLVQWLPLSVSWNTFAYMLILPCWPFSEAYLHVFLILFVSACNNDLAQFPASPTHWFPSFMLLASLLPPSRPSRFSRPTWQSILLSRGQHSVTSAIGHLHSTQWWTFSAPTSASSILLYVFLLIELHLFFES